MHLRPDRLRAHSATATELAVSVQAAVARRPLDHAHELAELDTTVRRAARELAELGAVLAAAAARAESAEDDVRADLRRVGPT